MKILINVAEGAVTDVYTDEAAIAMVKTENSVIGFDTTVNTEAVAEAEKVASFTSEDL